VQSHLKLILKI